MIQEWERSMLMTILSCALKAMTFLNFEVTNVFTVVKMINVSCQRLATVYSTVCSLHHIIRQCYSSWTTHAGSEVYWMNRLSKTAILNVFFMVYVPWASTGFHSCLLNYVQSILSLPCRTSFSDDLSNTWCFETCHHAKNLFTYISMNTHKFQKNGYMIMSKE